MSLKDFINQTINNDIEHLLETLDRLNEKSNIEQLKQTYMPDIDFNKKKEKTIIFKKKTKKNNHSERCTARCWGGANPVEYDHEKKKWIYGKQCKKKSVNNGYCTIHYKHSLRTNGLTNGDFFKDPPHMHYEKYKIKLIKNLNLN